MFVFKKPEPFIYRSEATGADFKFRQSSAAEKHNLELYIEAEGNHRNNKNLLVSWHLGKDDYYAAWLLEDFSGVQDENGNPHGIANFSQPDKAGLIGKLRETDPKFEPWFASHCEAANV
jgi:hypothetical protein